jgi:hypothetical protein
MVEVMCSTCGGQVLVIPSLIRYEIREELLPDVEAHLGQLTTDGHRLVIADDTGHFECPICGAPGYAPEAAAS